MEGLLAGRVAIVTGGGGGLGRGITEAFAAHGARVVVAEIDADRAQATVAAAGSAGGETSAMVLDVGDPGSATRLVAGALERYGRLDIVVNNVGHYLFAGSRFEETTEDHGTPSTASTSATCCASPGPVAGADRPGRRRLHHQRLHRRGVPRGFRSIRCTRRTRRRWWRSPGAWPWTSGSTGSG